MTQPPAHAWFPLDAETIRTAYLKAKAARLNVAMQVVPMVFRSTKTTRVYSVTGDSGQRYTVHLRPYTTPWQAACSRGGIHDAQQEGEACSHGLAAAVAWELQREAVTNA